MPKQVGTPAGSGVPVIDVLQEDGAPAIRVRHEGASGNAIEVVGSDGKLRWAVGRDGLPNVIKDVTLLADSPTLTLSGLDLTPYTVVRLFKTLRHAGTGATGSSGQWERTMLRFNGDATVANYVWEVMNSDATRVDQSSAGYAAGIEAGHMPAINSDANLWSMNVLDIPLPGLADRQKSVILRAGTADKFNGTGPFGGYLGTWGGGFWNNTAPITSITLLTNEGGNMLTGSRAILVAV